MLDLTVLYDQHGRVAGLEVTYAEPRVQISRQMLVEIYSGRGAGRWMPGVSMTLPYDRPPGPTDFWTGSVLRVEGINRTVIYRVGEYYPETDCYEMTWPD